MIPLIPEPDKVGLRASFSRIIRDCLNSTTTRTNPSIPHEPDYIATLVCESSKELLSAISSKYPKKKLALRTVFCHQKPLADYGKNPCPEIGDLLLVYRYEKSNTVSYNSLLLQAKICSEAPSKVKSSDIHQFTLYSSWPMFQYKRAAHLNGISRDITPKIANSGAKFLTIHTGIAPSKFRTMKTSNVSNPIHPSKSLSSELIDFVNFQAGKTIEHPTDSSSDEWTNLIWDLVAALHKSSSKRNHSARISFPRINTFGDLDAISAFDREIPIVTEKNDEDETYGIPTIVLSAIDESGD